MLRVGVSASVLVLSLMAAGCPRPPAKGQPEGGKDASAAGGTNASSAPGDATIFFTTEMRGEIEPCGCNSNPLGDLSRFAALVQDARAQKGKEAVAWLDGGSLLFSEAPALSEGRREQERLKAALILAQTERIGLTAGGLGRFDLADGKDAVKPARQAANLAAGQGVALAPPRVVDVGGVKLGVFGLANPEDATAAGLSASDPFASAAQVAAELRGQGAQVIVALTQLDHAGAQKLARKNLHIDFIVVGRDAPDPSETGGTSAGKGIEKTGDAYLIVPAPRGQTAVRIDLHLAAGAATPLVDAYGEERAKDRVEELARKRTELEQQLAAWKKDSGADPKFIADQEAQLAAWKQESDDLAANPVRKPASGSYFTGAHVLVQRKLRCDKEVVAAKRAFDKRAAETNLAAAAKEAPRPVPAGGSGYAGIEECAMCHKAAVDFWKKTHHAQAWKTLVDVGKDANRDCIRCHVTGWEQAGGATLLGVTKASTLRDVQCETCHGPAGRHVDSDGKERTGLVRSPPETTCKTCHEPAHSDSFDYQAYLRDVTGPGHGEKRRKSLGAGKTGHELRSAALAKAAQGVGEGCDR
jgi:2',3'-cyclic-nucleotide 2'-phosphodiesterase (5'-nucleotidase family)